MFSRRKPLLCYERALFTHTLVLAALLMIAHPFEAVSSHITTDSSGPPNSDDSHRLDTATINQICSTKRVKNSSLCKPCQCNPDGSESPHCDIYTRRCTCLPGYTGNTCNKCSQSYFNRLNLFQSLPSNGSNSNLEQDQSVTDEQAVVKIQCVQCDECHQHWRQQVAPLKDRAIRLIERAFELDQNFTDQIGAEWPDQGPLRLTFVGNRTTFSDIDQSISKIGELILEDKQKSDQVNLLEGELKSIIDQIAFETNSLRNQSEQLDELHSRSDLLGQRVELQTRTVGDLSMSIAGLKHEILGIQEYIPKIASRLIENSRDRTHKALEGIFETDRNNSQSLKTSIDELDLKLGRINFSKRQLDIIGSNILNNSIRRYVPEHLTSSDFVRLPTDVLECIDERVTSMGMAAKTITELSLNLSDTYQAHSETRSVEMTGIRRDIEAAKLILFQATKQLTTFSNNQTVKNIVQLSSMSAPNGFIESFNQLIENTTQTNRAALDGIDVKWGLAQLDLAELEIKLKNLNNSLTSTNLTTEIDKILARNLLSFEELRESLPEEDLNRELKRTKALADQLQQLKQLQMDLSDLKHETVAQALQTRRLVSETKIESDRESDWLLASNAFEIKTELASEQSGGNTPNDPMKQLISLNSTAKNLVLISTGLLDKVCAYGPKWFGQKMLFDRQMEYKMSVLRNSTTRNGLLAAEVENKVDTLSECLEAAEGTGVIGASDQCRDAIKLNERRRFANVIADLRQLSVSLHKKLAKVTGLSDDFVRHKRRFADQRTTMDSLHNQMDLINADLEKKYDFYENCPTA